MANQPKHGGGWPAIMYTLRTARSTGGFRRMWQALRTRNACKTCALGMGGQRGGMVNEQDRFPEFCKKSVQAMGADLQPPLSAERVGELSFDRLQRMDARALERLGRLAVPMIAGPLDLAYRPISWEEALDRIVEVMGRVPADESFFYLSGRSSNEAAFLLQTFARIWGTNNVNNCSYYCHQASGVGLASVTGSGTSTVTLEDLEGSDLVMLVGANPASNHPRLMRSLMDLKRRGGKVVVINPLREIGLERFKVPSDVRSMLRATRIADLYVQPNIGGDPMLLTAILKGVMERKAIDDAFVDQHVSGWEELRTVVESTPWDVLVAGSGVSRSDIDEIVSMYVASKATIFCWAMGLTHHAHGVQNIQHVANLALARGMLGSPGRGLMPLRGHSNVQGIGSVGVVPRLKEAFFTALEREVGLTLPTSEGLDTMACMEAAIAGRMRLAWCLGGNLWAANPDLDFAGRSLRSIDTVVYLNTTLNQGHVHGRGRETLVLPVLARDEESQATTQESMFNYVRVSDGGAPRFAGPRAESEIVADVAGRVLGPDAGIDLGAMHDHAAIRAMIARVVPGYGALAGVDGPRTGADREFQVEGRTFHQPTFATPSGRATAHPLVPRPPEPLGPDQVRIMTLRSEGQFNTVVYENEDFYRGQDRRDVILMNRMDLDRMGIAVDDRIRVTSEAGSLEVLARAYDVPPGNAAMYYPEANVLVPRDLDPGSRTPAFKCVIGTLSRP